MRPRVERRGRREWGSEAIVGGGGRFWVMGRVLCMLGLRGRCLFMCRVDWGFGPTACSGSGVLLVLG